MKDVTALGGGVEDFVPTAHITKSVTMGKGYHKSIKNLYDVIYGNLLPVSCD